MQPTLVLATLVRTQPIVNEIGAAYEQSTVPQLRALWTVDSQSEDWVFTELVKVCTRVSIWAEAMLSCKPPEICDCLWWFISPRDLSPQNASTRNNKGACLAFREVYRLVVLISGMIHADDMLCPTRFHTRNG
jgi:hypothetical protein